MLIASHCIVLLGVWGGLILGGYWLAARLTVLSPAERLSIAILAGLSLFIWNVSVLGFFRPLSGLWLGICLWPVAVTLWRAHGRAALWSDFRSTIGSVKGRVALLSFVVLLLALLWPLLARPGLVFFDGTSNHDAFFWISGAEFLREHTYMVEPVKSTVQPLTNGVGVFTGGWMPMWGRMSAEGLVALVSGLTGLPTVQIYVAATAGLFLPWVAAVYLVTKTFFAPNFTRPGLVALGGTQPLFVFFHGNANLPNLLGCLNGALVLVATTRCLHGPPALNVWHGLLAFSLHGLLCSYPEMAPFILLSVALLWGRALFSENFRRSSQTLLLAGFVGLALNPASTIRAMSGFSRSFHAASVDTIWPKLFEATSVSERLPALATLTFHTGDDMGAWLAGLCSVGLFVALIAVLRTARDRFGAIATLAGPAALLLYTLATHFSYGWQKVAQFGGIFIAAAVPVAAVNLASVRSSQPRFFLSARAALAGLFLFFTYATGRNLYESHKWSTRKFLGDDWLAVRDYARQHLKGTTVRVDAPSFSAPYFYGMWSLYALADSHPLFSGRETDNGGYVHDYTRNEKNYPGKIPSADFVSARWADSFDANSPRAVSGETVALLTACNRVEALDGFSPKAGVPEFASSQLAISLRPHTASRLQFTLTPRETNSRPPATWHATSRVDGWETRLPDVSGAPPWHFELPLIPSKVNRIEVMTDGAENSAAFPYIVSGLRVVTAADKNKNVP